MADVSSLLDRMARHTRRRAAQFRPHHLAAVLVVAVVAAGLVGVGALALPGPRPVLDGERMRIQVVAPVEPEITAGPVMEVGDLVNGLQAPPPSYAAVEPAVYASLPDDAWVGEMDAGAPYPKATRYTEEAVVRAPPQPERVEPDRRDRGVGRWFGFDTAERDYRAEREARRARREGRAERERERERMEARAYYSDGYGDRGARDWREEGPAPDRRH